MNYIKQIIYEMRERPLVTWITIAGTAISLFLLMAVYVTESVKTVAISPESNRSLVMNAPSIHIVAPGITYSGSMSQDIARTIYSGIDGVDAISLYSYDNQNALVSAGKADIISYSCKGVDSDFWNIFDFDFISGAPFTTSEVEAGIREAIISESVARELGNGSDLQGREIMINYVPYRVVGIVKDPNPILSNSWAEIWIAWNDEENRIQEPPGSGNTSVFLLIAADADPEAIKKEVKRRYEVFNHTHKADNISLEYHLGPYTLDEQNTMQLWSNTDPEPKTSKSNKWTLYLILLLLPAINLSGMTRSRLRRRINEIGVRRAFGATRLRILMQLIGENFLLTLAGGVIGLILSVVFTLFFSNLFVNYIPGSRLSGIQLAATPDFDMLFRWPVFLIAFAFCFLLNILSSGIPAWKASSVNPAEAISGKNS